MNATKSVTRVVFYEGREVTEDPADRNDYLRELPRRIEEWLRTEGFGEKTIVPAVLSPQKELINIGNGKMAYILTEKHYLPIAIRDDEMGESELKRFLERIPVILAMFGKGATVNKEVITVSAKNLFFPDVPF